MKLLITTILLSSLSLGSVSLYAGTFEENVDRLGSDYKKIDDISAQECAQACETERQCKAWTYVKPNTIQGPKKHCYLKNSVPDKSFNNACISGKPNRSVADVDSIKRLIAEKGPDIVFTKVGVMQALVVSIGGTLAVDVLGLDGPAPTRSSLHGSYLKQEACSIASRIESCALKNITDKIKENENLKLYIGVKKKAGGVGNKRVKALNAYLAWYGLTPGSQYSVKKLTRKEKKKSWLSKNNHIWMRIGRR